MQIINNRFLSLYDYNFLLVIEKIFSVNSKICQFQIVGLKIMIPGKHNAVTEFKRRRNKTLPGFHEFIAASRLIK